MTRDLKNDRWTCPNDRNLQLRSKLNAGWSYHTGKKAVLKKDPQLTESELIEIQKVLQRSEMVERNERDRVLKLVERLENMKRNVSQSSQSPNKCSLCGDYFCLIRSMPNNCSFCQKILCAKCCIETQYTVENETGFTQIQSRRNSITSICSSSSRMSVYLCRLCSEQREFLKKSGAWFLKKYPSYIQNSENVILNTPSHSEQQNSPFQSKKFIQPNSSTLSQNLSASSSSNSSNFRLWNKNKEANHLNNEFDNISDLSLDNDQAFNNESNQNNDSTSILNYPTSNENIGSKGSQLSPSKDNISPKDLNANNSSIKFPPENLNSSNGQNIVKIPSNSNLIGNNLNDDEPSSPNMNSYNYYSNIINNLKTSSNSNLNQETNSNLTNLNNSYTNVKTNTINNINNSKKLKNVSQNKNLDLKASNILSTPSSNGLSKFNNNITNISQMSNLNMPNMDSNYFPFTKNNFDTSKAEITKTSKKPKLLEWCSTQLSMEAKDKTSSNKFSKSIKMKSEVDDSEKSNDKKFKSFRFNNNLNSNTSKNSPSSPITSSKVHQNLNKQFNDSSFLSTGSMAATNMIPGSSALNIANGINKLNLN